MKAKIERHQMLDKDLIYFHDLMQRVYGFKKIHEYGAPIFIPELAQNKILANPSGETHCFHFKENNKYGGAILLQERVIYINNQYTQAFYPTDLATDSNTPLLSVALFKSVQEYATSQAATLYNTSNNKSDPIYSRILKKKSSFDLDYRILPISNPQEKVLSRAITRIFKIASKIIGILLHIFQTFSSGELIEICRFDEKVDALLSDFSLNENSRGERNSKQLNWRFASHKNYNYHIYYLMKGTRLNGYVVVKQLDFDGIAAIAIVDFVMHEVSFLDWVKVFWSLKIRFPNSNLIMIFANFKNKSIRKQLRHLVLRVPSRFKPQSFPIYFEPADKLDCQSIEKMYFTTFDIDMP